MKRGYLLNMVEHLFDQFQETMVLVLIVAAIISALISDWKDLSRYVMKG